MNGRLRGVGPTLAEFEEYPQDLKDAFTAVGAIGGLGWTYGIVELEDLADQAVEALYDNVEKFYLGG